MRSEGSDSAVIRELEARVQSDPDDFIAYNKLAGYYLQRMRETSSAVYLDLADGAARASLGAMAQNPGGLHALAQVRMAQHDFADAREQARILLARDPRAAAAHLLFGDASLELGEEALAEQHVARAEELAGASVATRTRLARIAFLHGRPERAAEHLGAALALAKSDASLPAETVAWCHWQLGELAFAVGDYAAAEQPQQAALETLPDYPRALAARGRLRAAQGDLKGAIADYERAVRGFPDPTFVAQLGDLYLLSGNARAAAAQYALVERMAGLAGSGPAPYARVLALFRADHDMQVQEAYASAAQEFKGRPDVYGADALAWTAYKAGHTAEAAAAMHEALRLGTQDARLLYHAGMIARAAGNPDAARQYLSRALELSPSFDPLQAPLARRALEAL
jgi:tetratricopeptide (TPR) repeat protein